MRAREVLPYGDRALLVQLADTRQVVAWHEAIGHLDVEVADLVPAAETLLVVVTEGADVDRVRGVLAELDVATGDVDDPGSRSGRAEPLEIPVRYDGPDLGDVARHTGLSEAEVVAAHTGATWRVAFGGFAPGFAYLVGDDDRLRVPRREASRTAVPAGAVGLAGEFSGVYPRESPGGWQLIGRTELAMWDVRRDPPALLAPGAHIRFVSSGS